MSRRNSAPRHDVDISEMDGVRYLHFGSDWVQGAMRAARPWSLELEYTREMMTGLLLRPAPQWPKKALLIGLGAGSLAKFLYRNRPECRITAVEINPQVEFVARQYFKLPDDPKRLNVLIGCGADYVMGGDSTFDTILVDGFGADGKPGQLDTAPFYLACRARLSENGLFAMNLLRERGFKQQLDRIVEAFSGQVLVLPPGIAGNTIVLAGSGTMQEASLQELAERAKALKQATRLDLQPTLRRMEESGLFVDGLLRL